MSGTGLLRTKTIEESIADTEEGDSQLRRSLGAFDLIVIGVGVTVGAGIFVTTGRAAATEAGPAVAVSFALAALACGLAALCYAEFASTVPVAGSAYTFSYASLGEVVAWIIGWDLILELALGAATVSSSWSTYLAQVLSGDPFGVALPTWATGQHHNLVAAAVVLVLTGVLCLGIQVSSKANAVFVTLKLIIVGIVIVAGLGYVKAGNYSPFVPPSGSKGAPGSMSTPTLLQDFGISTGAFGVAGVVSGAALVFFAFIGFDIVATAAEETKRPQKDLPRGIFGSLAIITVLYVVVSLVVTGMVHYDKLSTKAPLAEAFVSVGKPGIGQIISVGALIGLTTVTFVLLLGQSRVFFAMSRDGLLPKVFSHTSQRTGAPYRTTIAVGTAVAVLAAAVPLESLEELVNIGTLFAFIVVALGVLVLRRSQPALERAFRTPGVPVIPVLSVLASFYLMLNLPAATWVRFGVWMLLGLVIYAVYGRSHSRLGRSHPAGRPAPRDAAERGGSAR